MSKAVVEIPRDATSIELPPRKLVEAKDLYRIPLWAGTKLLYTVAPVPVLFRLARAKGAARWFNPRRRGRVLARMERFYGETRSEAEVRSIARRHLEFLTRRQLARLWPEIHNFADYESCRIEGLHHLETALATRRGAILATMHFGYGRLIKPLLESRGHTLWMIGNTGKDQSLAVTFTRLGWLAHSTVLRLPRVPHPDPADLQAGVNLRPILAALSRNEVLIVPLDTSGQHAKAWQASARALPILGKNILFGRGAMSLARATGAPVLPAFVVDSFDGPIGIKLEICPPLDLQLSDSRTADVNTNVERFAIVFENYLRRYPHQFHCDTVGTSESLKVGERVKVKGQLEDGSFVAFTVKIRPSAARTAMKGPIDRIDIERSIIRVLERDVAVAPACRLTNAAGVSISLQELAVGDVVELSGTYSGDEGFVPSDVRVARETDVEEQLYGSVDRVAVDGHAFDVLGFRVITTESTKIKDRSKGRPTRTLLVR